MRVSGIIIVISIISVLAAVVISGCLSGGNPPDDLLKPRENSEAGIKITAIYLPDITNATAFEIKVTAHKDYNDKFDKISYLRDSSGRTYQPISYEGEGGHHASGILRFPRIESKRFELVIKDIAGVEERIFKW
ncbi:MAG: hypothetical protein OIN66_15075 [Candidatus Methanoperedens sp.]|nr:hypothetical protein [Candidatus Methanoperedens sp.]